MKTLTKISAVFAALTISAGVLAHMGGGSGPGSFRHPMMDTDNPQYQAMLELRGNPEAMQAWMQNMRDNPEAMQEWREKMHANVDPEGKYAGYGCHGYWQEKPQTEE